MEQPGLSSGRCAYPWQRAELDGIAAQTILGFFGRQKVWLLLTTALASEAGRERGKEGVHDQFYLFIVTQSAV